MSKKDKKEIPQQKEVQDEQKNFIDFAKKLLAVPKKEIDRIVKKGENKI